MTKMPTIEEMEWEALRTGENGGIMYITVTDQRDSLHAIATELEAKLERIEAAIREEHTEAVRFNDQVASCLCEQLIEILEQENSDGELAAT